MSASSVPRLKWEAIDNNNKEPFVARSGMFFLRVWLHNGPLGAFWRVEISVERGQASVLLDSFDISATLFTSEAAQVAAENHLAAHLRDVLTPLTPTY